MAETPLHHADLAGPRSRIKVEFDSLRFRLKLGEVGRRLLAALAGLLSALLVVVMVDHAVPGGLPLGLIRGLGVALVAAALLVVGWAAAVGLRRLNPLFVARRLERSRGVANNVVINWLLVQRDRAGAYAGDSAIEQAARELERPSGEVEAARASPVAWLMLAGVIAAWIFFAAMTPKPIFLSLERLFGGSIDTPSATRIRLVSPAPGEALHAGEAAALVFAVEGRSAAELTFELLAGAAADAPPLLVRNAARVDRADLAGASAAPPGDLRRVSLAANEISRELLYRCRAGDALLHGVIPVLPRPDVRKLHVIITPPAYVDEPESTVETPDITAWAGSNATFEFEANVEVRAPVFVQRGDSESRTRMTITGAARRSAVTSVLLTEGGDYWFEFSDATGRPCPEPPPHRITVRRDQPPRIAIAEPQLDPHEIDPRPVDVTRVAWLKATAGDDVRLASVVLVIDRPGRAPQRRELLAGAAPPANESVTLGVATNDLELQPGDVARVWFEARDNRRLFDDSPAPQTSATAPITLTRAKLAPPLIPPTQKVAPANGDPGDAAAVAKRPQGAGEGDDGSASGQGAGDGSGKDGAPGGSYSDSPEGKPADTGGEGGIPDPSANAGEAEQQTGKPNASSGGEMTGGTNENQEGGLGDGNGAGSGEGSGGGAEPGFENELKQFVEKNGQAANEAKEAVNRSAEREKSNADDEPQKAEPADKPLPQDAPKPENRSDTPNSQPANPESRPADVAKPPDPPANAPPSEPKKSDEPDKPSQSQPAQPGQDAPAPNDDAKPHDEPPMGDEPTEKSDNGAKKPDGPPNEPDSKGETNPENQTPAEKPEVAPSPEAKVDGKNPPAPKPELPETSDAGTRAAPADAPDMPGGAPAPTDTKPPADATDRPGEMPGDHPKRAAEPAGADPAEPKSELVNTLELLERAEDMDEDSLADLPWPIEKKREFIADLKRLAASAKRAGVLSDLKRWRSRADLGELELQRGSEYEKSLGTRVGESGRGVDLLQRAVPPAEQKVAPGLRAALDAYYRSLATQRTPEN